jgi:hypothetical protein
VPSRVVRVIIICADFGVDRLRDFQPADSGKIASPLEAYIARPTWQSPNVLQHDESNCLGVSRLVVESIMHWLKSVGEAYCVKVLKSVRNVLEKSKVHENRQ